MIQSNNSNLSCERYLSNYSFDNVNCKYSNIDKLSEFYSLSNTPYPQLNSPDRYQVICNSRYYEDDLLKVVVETNKFNEAKRIFNESTKDCGESSSMRLSNTNQNNASENLIQSRKRNYNTSQDEKMTNLKTELNVTKIHKDETSKKYEFCAKETYENIKVRQNDDKKTEQFDYYDLSDYFDGTECILNKSLEQPGFAEFHIPIKLSTENVRIQQNDLSCKYDVFDYGHKNVDVDKLAIVDPNFNTKNEECYSINGDVLQLYSITPNKLTRDNDSVVSNISGVPDSPMGLANNNNGVSKVKTDEWKLIPIDCPLRVQITGEDIDIKICSLRDPRISHLRS